MKKILAMLMVLCLLVCVAACGDSTSDDGTTTGNAPTDPTISVNLDEVVLMFLVTDNGATDGSNPAVSKTTTDKTVMQSVIDILNAAEKTPCEDNAKKSSDSAITPSSIVVGAKFNLGSTSASYFVTDTNGVYTIAIGGYLYELSADTAEQVKTQIDAVYTGIEAVEQPWS